MGVETVVCKLVLVSVLYHVSAAPGCELEQIFETPRRDYDKLEIMERSNFDAGDSGSAGSAVEAVAPVGPAAQVAPPGHADVPRSVANAQIMLRFGGGSMGVQGNPEPKACSCGRFCQCGRTPYPVQPPLGFPGVYYVLPHHAPHYSVPHHLPQYFLPQVPQHLPQYAVPQHMPQHSPQYSVPQHLPQYSSHYYVPQPLAPQHIPQYSPAPQHLPHHAPMPQHLPQYSPVPQHLPHYSPMPQHVPQYSPMPFYGHPAAPYMPVPQHTPHYPMQMPHLPQIEHPTSLPDVRASKPQRTMIIIAKQRVLQKPPVSRAPEPPATKPEDSRPISNNHPEILQPIELSSDVLGSDKVTNEMIEAQIQKLEEKEAAQNRKQLAQELQQDQLDQKLDRELQQEQQKLRQEQLSEKLHEQEIIQHLQEERVRHAIAQKLQGIPPPQSHVKFVPMNFGTASADSPDSPRRNPRIEAAVNEALIPYLLKEQKPKLMVSYPIFTNEVPEIPRDLFAKQNLFVKQQGAPAEPQFQYSGYKITSGSGYYEDPYQRIVYNPPAQMSVMKAQTLGSRHNFDCECASCARYTKELNE